MHRIRHCREGVVRVRIRGYSPERFFNLCGQAEIELWDVCCRDGAYECCTTVRGFFALRPYARKSGVRLSIAEKRGLPFFLYRNRKRKPWALGFLAFFLMLYAMSLFLWDVRFQGNRRHTDNELLHFLESREIGFGSLKTRVDCEELEAQIRNAYPDITWVSARVEGTRLFVHVKENDVVLTVPEKDDTPCDLVAAESGVITSMVVRSGIPQVKAGDPVEKGQVLVSGRIPITDDGGAVVSERQVASDADITARVERVEERQQSLWRRVEALTGRKRKGVTLQAFGSSVTLMFPDLWKKDWKYTAQIHQLHVSDTFYLPASYGLIQAEEYVSYEANYTESELQALAAEYKTETEGKLREKGVQIIENNVTILVNDSDCRFQASLVTEEEIGTRAPIQTEEEPQAAEENSGAEKETETAA